MKIALVLDVNRALDEDTVLQDLALAKDSRDGVIIRTAHGQHFAEIVDMERVE